MKLLFQSPFDRMNSILRLYRGDSTRISKFDVTKTKKECLFGQGIYLTTNRHIASTYRMKDLDAIERECSPRRNFQIGITNG